MLKKKIKNKDVINLLTRIINQTNEEYINKDILRLKKIEIKNIKSKKISDTEKSYLLKSIEELPYYKNGKRFINWKCMFSNNGCLLFIRNR